MLSIPSHARTAAARAVALLSILWLAACEPIALTGAGGPQVARGEPVQVALLLPGGSGDAGDEFVAKSLRQAAELAVADLQGVTIDLRVYNTCASPSAAAAAARGREPACAVFEVADTGSLPCLDGRARTAQTKRSIPPPAS